MPYSETNTVIQNITKVNQEMRNADSENLACSSPETIMIVDFNAAQTQLLPHYVQTAIPILSPLITPLTSACFLHLNENQSQHEYLSKGVSRIDS